MSFDAGALGGAGTDTPDGGKYHFGIHGFDHEKGYPYDEIGHEDDNRWHLEGYFEEHPSCYRCTFAGNEVWFRIQNADDYQTDFRRHWPTEDSMCDGKDFSELFNIVAPAHPYLAASDAAIDMAVPDNCGSINQKPYDHLKWNIPLSWGSALPTSQDDAVGARCDVYNEAPASNDKEWVYCSSKFEYLKQQHRSYGPVQTDWVGDWVKYDPV